MARRRLTPELRRRELIEAGKSALKAKGTSVRVEDVTSTAKASKGTFFVYFPTWATFLEVVRNDIDKLVGLRFVEISKQFSNWYDLFEAFSFIHVQLVKDLDGLEVIYDPTFAAQIGAKPDANLDRLAFFLGEAKRAGAIKSDDIPRAARLMYAMILETTHSVLNGDNQEEACGLCGQFILSALGVRRLKRRAGFWPEV